MIGQPDLPPPLGELADYLSGNGFARRVEGPIGQYSDFCVTFRRGKLTVMVLSDRGGWSLLARRARWRDAFEPFVWRMCLSDNATPAVDPSLAEEAEWLREHVADVTRAIEVPWARRRRLYACLRDCRRTANMQLLTPEAVARGSEESSIAR